MHKLTLFLGLLLFTTMAQAAPSADLWSLWDQENPQSSATIDHSDWQAFLEEYVSVHEDGVNRVDYGRVADSAGKDLLGGYLEQLTQLDPREYNKHEQLAYWVNLYNALTVDVVLAYPKKKSILRMGKKFFAIGPWNDEVATVAGEAVTLNDIEHRILRPIWQDHRIHFAVNCASIGCPNLATTAYTAANAESLLQSSEDAYLAHPRGVNLTSANKLELSSIFDWYLVDFATSESEFLENYLAKRRPDIAAQITNERIKVKYDYDWSLNQVE